MCSTHQIAAETDSKKGKRTPLQALEARGRARNLTFLTLEVRQSNAPARALYEKLGYVQAGLRRNYYENPREDAVIMTKTL